MNTADCNCTGGLSGIYKHMAVMLYHAEDRVSAGMNKECSSVHQKLHRSRKQFTTSALLADVHISGTRKHSTEYVKLRWDVIDLRLGKYRRQKSPTDVSLTALDNTSTGNAVILQYV